VALICLHERPPLRSNLKFKCNSKGLATESPLPASESASMRAALPPEKEAEWTEGVLVSQSVSLESSVLSTVHQESI
jgi:hypothetical protein